MAVVFIQVLSTLERGQLMPHLLNRELPVASCFVNRPGSARLPGVESRGVLGP